jgi:hypothetical protein
MFTLAMMDGFERIELFGINMGSDTEYAYQRANMEYLIGFARARGIEVYIPQLSNLCKGRMYGYDSSMTGLRQKFEYRLRETETQHENNKKKSYVTAGYQKVFLDLETDNPALKKSQPFQALKEKAIAEATEAYNLYMLTNGANQEMGHIMNMFDAFVANSEDTEDGTEKSSFS